MENNKMGGNYRKWRTLAPVGLATIGFGLSLTGDATLKKGRGEPWLLAGTIGLCVVNAGVAMFGDAVKHRALYELRSLSS